MSKVYLFDWGDTLMKDFKDQSGKMRDWPIVEAVDGAYELLSKLSRDSKVYIATNAADSSEQDIQAAFERVDLSQFISGYFCKHNLGIGKGRPEFFDLIVNQLQIKKDDVTMIGDSLDKDIFPAQQAGIRAIWLNRDKLSVSQPTQQVQTLNELLRSIE